MRPATYGASRKLKRGHMFRALFARLTGGPKRGQALFGLAVREASRTHWFLAGQVPDTVNGRFAVLATVVALITLRLERDQEAGREATVALTERLVETLDAEIREMGLGDPTLGKQVRKLVGAVGGRVERWRTVLASGESWTAEVQRSVYGDEDVLPEALAHTESELRALWIRLDSSSIEELDEGKMQ
jgi:cytochrome b pre-mRNA-processing protein 3